MKIVPLVIVMIASAIALGACDKFTEKAASPPTITAQGFQIGTPQEGVMGHFGSLRVRIECPAGIQKLRIKERSYDIDLASTPERAHFQLFSLDRRVLLNKDVTLDFQNYINQKLQQPGEYTFSMEVTDKQDQTEKATVVVRVLERAIASAPEPAESVPLVPAPSESTSSNQSRTATQPSQSGSAPVKTGQFEIQRIGPHEIEGNETFGLAWKTIDPIHVTIRVRKQHSGASKLTSLTVDDYENVVTQDNLKQVLAFVEDQEHVDFNTANNAASGTVLGVVNLGKSYLIKSNQSTTTLSDTGTTVTLTGEYKYQ